ncbi:SDR family oxidoreductase [Luteimonas vadosa]|uniref:SDR family oxidoreductase n=1 Tax=Luteimonas vadosa TaxID=1165507 RepID=UPI0031EF9216
MNPSGSVRRNVLVTGANRGIGLEFVRQLLRRGDHVVATARAPGKAAALNALAGEHPGRLHVLPLDVADPKSHSALVAELPLVLGEDGRLDLLVNNAGVLHAGERFGAVAASALADSLQVNAIAPFLLTQTLAPMLSDGATVANISSQLGSIANCTRFGTPSYNISKAAQNMATRLLALALAERGIAVLALHPGWVQTDMGGEDATLEPRRAVEGLLATLEDAHRHEPGAFLDWKGERLPW